jgi:2-amino-4-hydroxy-6-hydroxymethyldihydropteridine diphosphokinase
MTVRAYVAIGANLGDARATVQQAVDALGTLPKTRLVAQSSLWRSAPFEASGPDFINAVAALDTGLEPHALLAALQALEQQAGRERPYRHAPRTLDLDLLCHGDRVLDTPDLTLPHPRMRQRAFVMLPLAEIAPQLVTPQQLAAVRDQTIERL